MLFRSKAQNALGAAADDGNRVQLDAPPGEPPRAPQKSAAKIMAHWGEVSSAPAPGQVGEQPARARHKGAEAQSAEAVDLRAPLGLSTLGVLDTRQADFSYSGSHSDFAPQSMGSGGRAAIQRPADKDCHQRRTAARAAARRGAAGAGGTLPYFNLIQRAFGRHDISHIRAHLDGSARAAATELGEEAYAFGHHIVFSGYPDLHTAAHEAAHVIQQAAGVSLPTGFGEEDDAYEVHANAVADLVVNGESAEALLDQFSGGARAEEPAIQCAPKKRRSGSQSPESDTMRRIDPPIPGINKTGFVFVTGDGVNIRSGPQELGGQLVREHKLPPGTRVFISGRHPKNPAWWYVTAFLPEAILRGYVWEQIPDVSAINTDLPEPTAKLYYIKHGDNVETIAKREFSAAVTDGHDLRYYENVLLAVNHAKGLTNGIKGTYQEVTLANVFTGGANNIQLNENHFMWLVSPGYAKTLQGIVPSGSLTGGVWAKAKRALQHIEDIVQSVTDAPKYFLAVAGQYAEAILEHLPEIIGITAGFIVAEAASAFLAATPTGVGQLAAVLIQLALAAFCADMAVDAGKEALKHGAEWLTLAWTARGRPQYIQAASEEFLRMLVSIAMAALAVVGVRGSLAKSMKFASSIKLKPPKVTGGAPEFKTETVDLEPVPENVEAPVAEVKLPKTWSQFATQLNEGFRTRLAEFRGNNNLSPTASGGEGRIFSANGKTTALKRWFESRLGDMPESISKLEDVRAAVNSHAELSQHIEVVKIYETGPDWILRDFDANSVELKVGGGTAEAVRATAIRELEQLASQGQTTPELLELLKKLKREPPSANLHWSAAKQKIIVIDML